MPIADCSFTPSSLGTASYRRAAILGWVAEKDWATKPGSRVESDVR